MCGCIGRWRDGYCALMGRDIGGLLHFRVLGPLEVSRNGTPIRLGGERQRALLALLLVHANELITTDRLVEELFGGELSEGAVGAVRVAVSRLRRLLENGDGGSALATAPGGYVLQTEPEQLDVAVFERLLREGQELLGGGDAGSAARRLHQALALWRGPPLADLALLEFLQPEIRRLEELRLVATMDQVDADLATGRGAELIAQIEGLVASNPLQERVRGQLILALYRAGRQADALAVYRQTSELLRDELGLEPSRALQELERSVLQQDRVLDVDPRPTRAVTGVEDVAVCPFKGLAFFDRSDAEYFCGREHAVSELVTRLAAATLVGIVGPSGIGKSSLLRAGVLPALSAGVLPGSKGWRQVLLRPGQHPCIELARALGTEPGPALARLAPGERLVIAVDQLEELFTVCEGEDERAAFLQQVSDLARDTERRALLVVSLRADFYGRCASFSNFAGLLSHSHVLVGPMDRDELSRAVTLPAARAGLEVEPALVDALVADVAGEPGGLPLMSTALLELWRAREGRMLGYRSYRASGGVDGAVARLAEEAYSRLSEEERLVARGLMLRLASGAEDSLVRRRLPLAELEPIGGVERVLAALTDARLLTVSDGTVEVSHEALFREWPRFRAWIDEDRTGRRVHDHLAASAQEWAARGRDRADLYRGARLAGALEWVAQHPLELGPVEKDFIEAGRTESEREEGRERAQNRRLRGLLAGVGVLLAVSVIAGLVALVKQHSAAASARGAETAARVALARQLGSEAVTEPRIDVAMLLAREAVNLDRDPQTEGTLLATLLRSPSALGTFALPIDARPQGVALSPDGRTVAVPDNNHTLWFYDARTHAVQRTLTDPLTTASPVYSSDGSLLLYSAVPMTGKPFVAVRDAHTLRLLRRLQFDRRAWVLPTYDDPAGGYLVAPGDRTAYWAYWVTDAAGNPGAAYLDRWSLRTGRLLSVTALGGGPVLAQRLFAGGTRLAVVSATRTVVYETRSMRRLSSVPITPAPGANATRAAISPDGRTAAIGSSSGSVSFVDLSTGQSRSGAGGHSSYVARVVYSPDGRVVVSTGDDDKVIVWDPRSASPLETLTGHDGAVHGAAISADGRTLYTASLDGDVLEWDLGGDRRFGRPFSYGPGLPNGAPDTPGTPPLAVSPDGARFAVRIGQATVGLFSTQTLRELSSFAIGRRGGVITDLAWSPVGSELAVTGHSGMVQLWTLSSTPRVLRSFTGLRSLTGLPEAVQAVAFGRGGTLLAASDINHTRGTGPPDGHVAVWRTSTGGLLAAPRDLGQAGDSIAFSRDGRLLAVGLDQGPTLILDATTGRVRQTLHPFGGANNLGVTALAFTPDGTLATGSWAGIVQLWNAASAHALGHPVLVAAAPVASIAFDPSGSRFATTGGSDGSTKLWFTPTLQQQGSDLQGQPGTWGNAVFSPDGSKLIAIADDGKGFEWSATPNAWKQHACAVAGRNLTREEWARFVTGHSYAPVCP
jgi:WD40 repeat protein/DNA-binding SARP family transcriptional activator/energy-coupling factor transporter ATP-binding protein EcfA2